MYFTKKLYLKNFVFLYTTNIRPNTDIRTQDTPEINIDIIKVGMSEIDGRFGENET